MSEEFRRNFGGISEVFFLARSPILGPYRATRSNSNLIDLLKFHRVVAEVLDQISSSLLFFGFNPKKSTFFLSLESCLTLTFVYSTQPYQKVCLNRNCYQPDSLLPSLITYVQFKTVWGSHINTHMCI